MIGNDNGGHSMRPWLGKCHWNLISNDPVVQRLREILYAPRNCNQQLIRTSPVEFACAGADSRARQLTAATAIGMFSARTLQAQLEQGWGLVAAPGPCLMQRAF